MTEQENEVEHSASPEASDPFEHVFKPEVGRRVTIDYPYWSVNNPTRLVGEIRTVEDSGCFYVITQPMGHVVCVNPENFAKYGVTYREWRKDDKWPHERERRVKEKKKLREVKRVRKDG